MSTRAIRQALSELLKSPWGSDVRLAHEGLKEVEAIERAAKIWASADESFVPTETAATLKSITKDAP